MQGSAMTWIGRFDRSSLRARIATAEERSSPETKSTTGESAEGGAAPEAVAAPPHSAPASCSSSVDFPTPGSPLISVTLPGTMPPERT